LVSGFVFLITFIFIVDYYQIELFVLSLLTPSVPKSKNTDKSLLNLVRKKAGFNLKHITVIESNKMYGGISGVPGFPQMYLSSQLLQNLNKEELEYVILHESAHFKYFHPVVTAATQVILIALGLYLSNQTNIIYALLLAIFFSFLSLLVARKTERVAENFAAKNMENPKAMITAVNKFEKNWIKDDRAKLLKKFMSWNISYEEKREIARKYIR